jgi:hypothetical protein
MKKERVIMKRIKLSVIILFILVVSTSSLLAYVYWECDGRALKWRTDPVIIRPASVSFPANNPYQAALGGAIAAWNLNPSKHSFLIVLPGVNTVALDNGRNEAWFSDDQDLLKGARAVTFCEYDCGSGAITEADVVFDVNQPLTPYNNKYVLGLYGGSSVPFDALALHEYGHALGIDHEDRWYNIMYGLAHLHTNGQYAFGYPGEDACNGAVFLYGVDNNPRRQDVAVSHWRITTIPGLGANGLNRTVVYDHEPHEAAYWLEFVETVDGFVAWRDCTSEPRFKVCNGQKIWVEFTYENNGADTQNSISVDFYLSNDDYISANDRLFFSRSMTLGRDVPATWALPVVLPNDLPEGSDYALGVILDKNGSIGETGGGGNATYLHIRIVPAYPVSLSFSPWRVWEGMSSTGTVTLAGAAPPGGCIVDLSSGSPYVTLPSQVTVAAGQKSASFTVETKTITGGLGTQRADIYARRQGGTENAVEGSLRIVDIEIERTPETELALPPRYCDLFPSSTYCNWCRPNPFRTLCLLLDALDQKFPLPPWAYWNQMQYKHGFAPDEIMDFAARRETLINIYKGLDEILGKQKLDDIPLKTCGDLKKHFEAIDPGFYFDAGQKRSLAQSLAKIKALTPELVNILVEAANAVYLDLEMPPRISRELVSGGYASAEFGGIGWIGLRGLKASGMARLSLRKGLPAPPDNFRPIWPLVSYVFTVAKPISYDFADVTINIERWIPADTRNQLRIYEWDGVHYRDITLFVDDSRGIVTGRTKELKQYVIGRLIGGLKK